MASHKPVNFTLILRSFSRSLYPLNNTPTSEYKMSTTILLFFSLYLQCLYPAFAATAEQWRARSIYQSVFLSSLSVLSLEPSPELSWIDLRFQLAQTSMHVIPELRLGVGVPGTGLSLFLLLCTYPAHPFQSITQNLDYIQDAGFTASAFSFLSPSVHYDSCANSLDQSHQSELRRSADGVWRSVSWLLDGGC